MKKKPLKWHIKLKVSLSPFRFSDIFIGKIEKIWELEELMPQYDQYLAEYIYDKIWSELSEIDRKIISAMSNSGKIQIKDLRAKLDNMSSEKFSVYRERFKRKGLINVNSYGKISLSLPRFDKYTQNMMYEW